MYIAIMKQKLRAMAEYIKSTDCSHLKSSLQCSKEERETLRKPFPLAKLIAINFSVFVNQLGTIVIFPFLPFMIHDFFPNLRRSELGKKAGFLGAAYFIGNLPGTIVLGLISDLSMVGRKPVLLLATFFGAAFTILFGFSLNFGWAMASRMFWGFTEANIGVAKAYISEVCEESMLSTGFAIYGAFYALGRVTGSIVGGILARPASKYSVLELPFFCDFPYLLPCSVGASLGFLAVLGGTIIIRDRKTKKRESSPSNHSELHSDMTPLLESEPQHPSQTSDDSSERNFAHRLTLAKWKLVELSKASASRTKKIFLQYGERNLLLATFIITAISYVTTVAIELLPLLFVNDFAHGGYEMDDTETGVMMVIATVVHLPFQLILLPWLMVCLGYRHTFRMGLIVLFACNFLVPFSTAITGPIRLPSDYNETYLNSSTFCNGTGGLSVIRADSVVRITWNVWLWLITINAVNIAGRGVMIGCNAVFINNASLPSTRGTINGVSQAISKIGNILAPLLGGSAFAWSENNGLAFPLNFHFLYNINCVLLVFIFLLSFLLPRSIEHARTEDGGTTGTDSKKEKMSNTHPTESENNSEMAKEQRPNNH